jgi:uncharacterized protein (TIGR02271 family)
MNYEKIVTLYDTEQHAEDAKHNLEAAGFRSGDMSTLTGAALAMGRDKLAEPGLWHRLFGRDVELYEAAVYGRVIGSGGAVLTVRVPESDVPRALGILNAHKAVDIRDRAVREGLIPAIAAKTTLPPKSETVAAAKGATGEEVFRLAEEHLDIGKRLVREGTTRIRRYVVETPVEHQVTLHEEHVKVIRRAISDPGSLQNIDWTEKTIEVNETAEEPIITKSAHLTEEVVIQKESSDHVQTVKDKVRRQQVEVERTPGLEPVAKK